MRQQALAAAHHLAVQGGDLAKLSSQLPCFLQDVLLEGISTAGEHIVAIDYAGQKKLSPSGWGRG